MLPAVFPFYTAFTFQTHLLKNTKFYFHIAFCAAQNYKIKMSKEKSDPVWYIYFKLLYLLMTLSDRVPDLYFLIF